MSKDPICSNCTNPQPSTAQLSQVSGYKWNLCLPVGPFPSQLVSGCSISNLLFLDGWIAAFMVVWKMRWAEEIHLSMVAVTNTKKHSLKMTYRTQWLNVWLESKATHPSLQETPPKNSSKRATWWSADLDWITYWFPFLWKGRRCEARRGSGCFWNP